MPMDGKTVYQVYILNPGMRELPGSDSHQMEWKDSSPERKTIFAHAPRPADDGIRGRPIKASAAALMFFRRQSSAKFQFSTATG
jgi:hypothetical protein